VAGFGTEVLSDPLFWMTGPLGSVTKKGSDLMKAARGTRRLSKSEDLTEALARAKRAVEPLGTVGKSAVMSEDEWLKLNNIVRGNESLYDAAKDIIYSTGEQSDIHEMLHRAISKKEPLASGLKDDIQNLLKKQVDINLEEARDMFELGELSKMEFNDIVKEAMKDAAPEEAEEWLARFVESDDIHKGWFDQSLLPEVNRLHGKARTIGIKSYRQYVEEATKSAGVSETVGGLQGVTSPAVLADQLEKGLRSTFGFRNPFSGNDPFLTLADLPGGRMLDELMAKAVRKTAYGTGPISKWTSMPVRGLRAMFAKSAGGNVAGDTALVADMAFAEAERLGGEFMNLWPVLEARRIDLEKVLNDAANVAGRAGDANAASDFLRKAVEELPGIPQGQQLKGAFHEFVQQRNLPGTAQMSDELAGQVFEYLDGLQYFKNKVWEETNALGLHIPDLAKREALAKHFPRRKARTYYDLSEQRQEMLVNLPGGTDLINRIARNPLFTGTKHLNAQEKQQLAIDLKAALGAKGWALPQKNGLGDLQEQLLGYQLEEAMNAWDQKYLDPATFQGSADELKDLQAKAAQARTELFNPYQKTDKNGVVHSYDPKVKQLRDYFHSAPKEMRDTGLFAHDLVMDMSDYVESAIGNLATMREIHHFLGQKDVLSQLGQGGADEIPLEKAWYGHKFNQQGLRTFVSNNPDLMERLGVATGDPLDAAKQLGISAKASRVLRAYRDMTSTKTQNELLKTWDKINTYYKWALTTPFPAFHARNLMSGFWQSWSDGWVNAPELMKGYRELARYIAKPAAAPLDADFLNFLETSQLLKNTRILELVGQSLGQQLPEKGLLGGVLDLLSGPAWTRRATEAMQAKGIAGQPSKLRTVTESLHPFRVPGVSEVTGGKAPLSMASEVGRHTFEWVEAVNRAGYAKALWDKGYRPAEIVNMVRRAQFDYSRISSFDKNVMKRVVPFWSFTRLNVPFQLSKLLERPGGRTAQTFRLFAGGDEEAYKPSFLRERISMPSPEMPDWAVVGKRQKEPGDQTFLTQSGLPIEDLNRLMAFGPKTVQRVLEKNLAMAHPLITAPYKVATGRDPYFGREVKEAEPLLGSAWAQTVAGMTPASRLIQEIRRVGSQKETLLEKALGQTTGMRFKTYDVERSKMLDLLNAQKRIAESTPGIRSMDILYAPDELEGRRKETAEKEIERLRQLERLKKAFYQARQRGQAK
jgi:hypothetical protein